MFTEFSLNIKEESKESWNVRIIEYTGIRELYIEFDIWLNGGVYRYDKKYHRYIYKYEIIGMIRRKQYKKEEKIKRNKCNLLENYIKE